MMTSSSGTFQWNPSRPRYRGAMTHLATMLVSVLATVTAVTSATGAPPTVHSISDISQEFTFYMDGRFHRQYLKDHGRDARNWGTLSKADLSNANLSTSPSADKGALRRFASCRPWRSPSSPSRS